MLGHSRLLNRVGGIVMIAMFLTLRPQLVLAKVVEIGGTSVNVPTPSSVIEIEADPDSELQFKLLQPPGHFEVSGAYRPVDADASGTYIEILHEDDATFTRATESTLDAMSQRSRRRLVFCVSTVAVATGSRRL